MIVSSFKNGGILEGLLAIGKTLLDAVLMPLQQLLELLSKIPGSIGEFAGDGAAKILELRNNMGVNTTTDEGGKPIIDNTVTREQLATQRSETLVKTHKYH